MTSPTDINVPTRSALVLETKASFLLLRFVNSDVSYYGHPISEEKKRKRKHGKFACKINSGEQKPVLDRVNYLFFNDFFVNKGSTVIS